MSGRSRRPAPPIPPPQRQRTHSLSIARSPSVLSAGPFITPPATHNHPDEACFPFILGESSSAPLARTQSHPPRFKVVKPNTSEIQETDEDDEAAALHPSKSVTFDAEDQVREFEEENSDEEAGTRVYTGSFQAPDRSEMMGIIASVVGVFIVALAAGLTTVYDWVL